MINLNDQQLRGNDDDVITKYLVPQFDVHLTPRHATLHPPDGALDWKSATPEMNANRGFRIHKYHKYPCRTNLKNIQVVNQTGKEILLLADGNRTGSDICKEVIFKYELSSDREQELVASYLRQAVAHGYLSPSSFPQPTAIRETGSLSYWYPPHISLEVTANCNIRCVHCYGTFEQRRFDQMSKSDVLSFLKDSIEAGLNSIELTGGECTTHPDFNEILAFCCENLVMVGVLTNGVNIKEPIFETLVRNADKVLVQICINGNREYHNKFTKSPVAYDRSIESIRRLAAGGVFVNTPMNLTYENYTQIEDTAMCVMEAGSMRFMVAFIDYSYGRASELKDRPVGAVADCSRLETNQLLPDNHKCNKMVAGLTCVQQIKIQHQVVEKMRSLQAKFPGFIRIGFEEPSLEMAKYDEGCGAAKRSLYVASNGKVGLCPMSVETGIPGFGDIKTQSLSAILNSDYARHYASLPAPNDADCTAPNGEPCPNRRQHRGCILHGVRQYMKTPATCYWGQKYDVDKLIAEGHHDLRKLADGSYDIAEVSHFGTGCGSGHGAHADTVSLTLEGERIAP